jgi:hypothetical protein
MMNHVMTTLLNTMPRSVHVLIKLIVCDRLIGALRPRVLRVSPVKLTDIIHPCLPPGPIHPTQSVINIDGNKPICPHGNSHRNSPE